MKGDSTLCESPYTNIALDEDTSYLDEISAPNAPTKEPGADSVAVNADGVMVDEFGLPKIPTQN